MTDVIADIGDDPQDQSDQKNDQTVDDRVEGLHPCSVAHLGFWRGARGDSDGLRRDLNLSIK